jgi:hypothetical protein
MEIKMGKDSGKQQTKDGSRFALWAARLSLLVPVVTLGMNIVVFLVVRGLPQAIMVITSGALIVGVILSIMALAAVRKQGRKGILGHAVTGAVLNGVLITSAIFLIPALKRTPEINIPAYSEAQLRSMPNIIENSTKVIDTFIGFRLEIPKGFESNPSGSNVHNVLYSYVKFQPGGSANISINIGRLGGTISKEPTSPRDIEKMRKKLPKASTIEVVQKSWQGYPVEAFISRIPLGGTTLTTWSVQIPLAREAIQIHIAGPTETKEECQSILDQLLSSLKGKSNWDYLK